ncbi:hypothetical protein OsI_36605 [Oryza sativa Indica Group]|uniref:Uncharacterized protein n=1 Tax=Oryza sativa subsp. indica TaxID=39946 RepID=A2ZFQ0_ORYSI|nr:hypothetical protein OsI_36605 [Oryza sativa Indica Group]
MAGGEKEWRKIASRRTDRGGARIGEQGCSWRSTTMAKQAEERDGCRAGEGASWRRAGRGRGSASTAIPTTKSTVAESPAVAEPPAVAIVEPPAVVVDEPPAATVAEPPWPQSWSSSLSLPRSPSLSPPVSAAAPEGE